MKQLQKHIVLLLGLIALSIALAFWKSSSTIASNFDKSLFIIADTSEIQNIRIIKSTYEVNISRSEGNWILNDSLKTDQSLIQIFNVIMSKVQVVRPVSQINLEEVKKDILNKGQKVTISTLSGQFEFYCGGNASKSQAYFADAELNNIYLVSIPGYNNYLSGIFELTVNQWRDRVLFASSWRTIQKLTIDYLESNDQNLNIYFDSKFMKVDGIGEMDTTSLISYLEQYENFQVNDYLNRGEFPRFDSLLNTNPVVKLTLVDIDQSKNESIFIYQKIADQRFYLFKDDRDQMIVIDEKRVNNLLKSPSNFAL